MNDYNNFNYIGVILLGFAHFIMLIGSIILVIKQKSLGSFLILTGSTLVVITALGGFLWVLIAKHQGVESILQITAALNIFKGLSHTVLAIGVIIFARALGKK
ncbi:MAG: hypothetical protein AAFO99_13580 [Bacteroidota bacterium]